MRVHGNHLNSAATNLYSAAAAEKAAAAKQAAEVRKKLKAGTSKIDAESDFDAVFAIGGESNESPRQPRDQQIPTAQKKKQNPESLEDKPSASPISMWG